MSRRFEELDSIRGIAALTVVFSHCMFATVYFYNSAKGIYVNKFTDIITNSPLHIFWAGREAVMLFFVLSGFVLSLQFLRPNNVFNYKEFIIKRFFRIYIPYIIVMMLSVVTMVIFSNYTTIPELSSWFDRKWNHPITLEAMLSYIFMLEYDTTNVNGPTWSLVHEMRISFAFPILMFLVIKKKFVRSLFLGLGVTLTLWIVFDRASRLFSDEILSLVITSFSDSFYYSSFFVIGALFAKYKDVIGNLIKKRSTTFKTFLFILAIIFYTNVWTLPFLTELKLTGNKFIVLGVNLIIDYLIIGGVLLFFSLALFSNRISNILNYRLFAWLGKISYSLYLIHALVLVSLPHMLSGIVNPYIALLLVPFASILLAMISFKYLETPSINFGRKVINFYRLNKSNSANKVV